MASLMVPWASKDLQDQWDQRVRMVQALRFLALMKLPNNWLRLIQLVISVTLTWLMVFCMYGLKLPMTGRMSVTSKVPKVIKAIRVTRAIKVTRVTLANKDLKETKVIQASKDRKVSKVSRVLKVIKAIPDKQVQRAIRVILLPMQTSQQNSLLC